MISQTKIDPTTIWFMPGTPFPRRVTYYLKAKSLPRTLLAPDQLNLIPVLIDPTAGTVESLSGLEKRPVGYTSPVMRIGAAPTTQTTQTSETTTTTTVTTTKTTASTTTSTPSPPQSAPAFITQSATILEYLEDLFPATAGHRDLLGATPLARARVRDIVGLTNDALAWTAVHFRHASSASLAWSDMDAWNLSPGASDDALQQVRKAWRRVENLCRGDVLQWGCFGIAGTEGPTVADVVVAAAVVSAREMYGFDHLEGCEALGVWMERFCGSEWFVSAEEMEAVERGEVEVLFV